MRDIILFLFIILICCSCTVDRSRDDKEFIKRRTGLSLDACSKQLLRVQTDFSLQVKYQVTNPNDFIVQNRVKQLNCGEVYDSIFYADLLKQNLICFGKTGEGWYASVNKDSSYCTIVVSFPDFAGQ